MVRGQWRSDLEDQVLTHFGIISSALGSRGAADLMLETWWNHAMGLFIAGM
jgi:hypothetical protein